MCDEQLAKLIDNLKYKIKKLENYTKKSNDKINSIMETYRIEFPILRNNINKKYIGLSFSSNIDYINEHEQQNFIILKKNINIINYSITLKVTTNNIINKICIFSLGLRDGLNKIKIIKGSKEYCDITKNLIDDTLIINNTTLCEISDQQELCLIANISNNCVLIGKKSIIKIINL